MNTQEQTWMVSLASSGLPRQSITRLTEGDAHAVLTEFARQLVRDDGWTKVGTHRNLIKLQKGTELLFLSVTNAAEVFDVQKPPQHWLTRGITKVVQA